MPRRGLTLLELLVVVAIVGILAGLALVAVNRSREASRQATCRNHFRQVGVALSAYVSAAGRFPIGVVWSPPGEPLGEGLLPIGVLDRVARFGTPEHDTIYQNWLVALLPHLGEEPLWRQFDSRWPSSDARNAGRAQFLPVLACPSDPYCRPELPYARGSLAGRHDLLYARGNVAINVGPDATCLEGVNDSPESPCLNGYQIGGGDLLSTNDRVWGRGIAGVNVSFAPRDVSDGLSHTVVVDEIRAGIDRLDPRGAWALGQVGASAVAGFGMFGPGQRPNSTDRRVEKFIGCTLLTETLGPRLKQAGMACDEDPEDTEEYNGQACPRSLHPGGVHVLLGDGTVHFVADRIDPEVWHALHTRAGGEMMPAWQ